MKYFLVCFFLSLMACKSTVRDTGSVNVMVGLAKNDKAGAVLYAPNGICLIKGLNSWDSIHIGKKVKVKGDFKLKIWEINHPEHKDSIVNKLQAQIYPKYYSVMNATWELYYGY